MIHQNYILIKIFKYRFFSLSERTKYPYLFALIRLYRNNFIINIILFYNYNQFLSTKKSYDQLLCYCRVIYFLNKIRNQK